MTYLTVKRYILILFLFSSCQSDPSSLASYQKLCASKTSFDTNNNNLTEYILPNGKRTLRFRDDPKPIIDEWNQSAIAEDIRKLNLISFPETVCNWSSRSYSKPLYQFLGLKDDSTVQNYLPAHNRIGWTTKAISPRNLKESKEFEVKPIPALRHVSSYGKRYETSLRVPESLLLRVSVAKAEKILTSEIETNDKDKEDPVFWKKVLESDLPVILTEGTKKAAAVISAGYAAIGIQGACRALTYKPGEKNLDSATPANELSGFLENKNRLIYIVFDNDKLDLTRKMVYALASVLGKKISQNGNRVKILDLPGDTKGVDDYLFKYGEKRFTDEILNHGMSVEEWDEKYKDVMEYESIFYFDWCHSPCQGECILAEQAT